MGRCDSGHKLLQSSMRCEKAWGGVTVVRECDSHQGGVNVLEMSVSLMENCNGNVESVKGCGEV